VTAVTFHPATPERVAYIAAHLRAMDRAELAITSPGEAVAEILDYSVAASRWAIVVEVDGRPAIVYGVAPTTDPMIGRAWLLATDDLLKITRRFFLDRCRREVRLMQQKFAVLTNEAHRDNVVVLRWLEWLGFYIDRDNPVGPNGELFVFWKGAARRV
jgi:hypothetical protein